MANHIDGAGIAAISVGILFIYGGVKGYSPLKAAQNVIQGNNPNAEQNVARLTADAAASSVSSGTGQFITSGGGNPAANKRLGQAMAASYGWGSGSEWTALDDIVESESGWNNNASNPNSGARGIAQKITGYDSSYQQNNPAQQIAWLLAYIKSRYGDPIAAWNFHKANGWY